MSHLKRKFLYCLFKVYKKGIVRLSIEDVMRIRGGIKWKYIFFKDLKKSFIKLSIQLLDHVKHFLNLLNKNLFNQEKSLQKEDIKHDFFKLRVFYKK